MNVQEAKRAIVSNCDAVKRNATWFKPQTLYLLLGVMIVIGLLGTYFTPHNKRDANDIASPFDSTYAPPQTPDRSAIVLQTAPKAIPASQGAGPEALSERGTLARAVRK